MSIEKILYTATATATGGREGQATSSDGALDVKLSTPRELGGGGGNGTNPEQLFAAGWSACFEGAMGGVARAMRVDLPGDLSIDAEVDLRLIDGEYLLAARLHVTAPGLPRDVAQALVDAAERGCPYTKAIQGNVPYTVTLV